MSASNREQPDPARAVIRVVPENVSNSVEVEVACPRGKPTRIHQRQWDQIDNSRAFHLPDFQLAGIRIPQENVRIPVAIEIVCGCWPPVGERGLIAVR